MTDADYAKISGECDRLLRHFADRQNSDSVLTAREAHAIVNTLANARTAFDTFVKRRSEEKEEEGSCPTTSTSNPI